MKRGIRISEVHTFIPHKKPAMGVVTIRTEHPRGKEIGGPVGERRVPDSRSLHKLPIPLQISTAVFWRIEPPQRTAGSASVRTFLFG